MIKIDDINGYVLLRNESTTKFAVDVEDINLPKIQLLENMDETYSISIITTSWGAKRIEEIGQVVKYYNAAEQAARKIKNYLEIEHAVKFK
ncbi:hypothetical protein [Enterococcus sp. UD-01]|jgi:hypothetical protein|uniref:hypothetical protein n=1 Tax=Enterococcus sp. UD-01 TaxID=3373911 RepID=UPI003834DB7E